MLLVGVAAAIAVGVGVMLWAIGPTYSLLYSNLAAEETAQITQALDARAHSLQARRRGQRGQRPGRTARLGASQARRAGPARERRRRERHDQGSRLRRQPVHGERALPARARNRARAHHRLACRTCRARACTSRWRGSPRSSAIVVRAPRRCSCSSRPAAGSMTSRCRRSRISSRRAFRNCRAAQVTVVDQAGRLLSSPDSASDAGAPRQDVRVRASPRRVLCEPHPGDADAARRSGPRARAGRRAGRHGHHRIRRASSSIRRARSCAASPRPRRPRRTAAATRAACPVRSRTSRRSPASHCRPARQPAVAQSRRAIRRAPRAPRLTTPPAPK